MSDNEGQTKKSGYRLEYASSGRAKCKGTKPCAGTTIPKGALRMGSIVDFRGNTSYVWRHWGCVTPKIITNMKSQFENADELDGFEDLNEEDQERVKHAWEEGKVADEDIPESARKPAGEGDAEDAEEKPKKKRAPAKKKVEAEGDEEEKPKRKRATKAKKVDEEAEDDEEAEEKPAKAPARKPRAKKPVSEGDEGAKKKAAPRKQPAKPKKKVAKDESDGSGEDFAGEMAAAVEDDEEEEEEEESSSKKRKRPAAKQAAPAKKPRAASSRAKKSKAVVEEEDDQDEE